jgi:fumarylacetoacetase
MKSWIDIPLDSDFSLANIPFGICSFPSSSNNNNNHATFSFATLAPSTPRCCTAIGNYAVDLHLLAEAGLLDNLIITAATDNDASSCVEITNFHPRIVFSQPTLNELMSCEKCIWVAVRNRLISLFLDSTGSNSSSSSIQADNRLQINSTLQSQCMHLLSTTLYHLPASIGDYTDFYSSREHATNVGIMFRGKDNALQPNWLHLPVGYHGRSSSVYPSLSSSSTTESGEEATIRGGKMSMIRRPCGQLQIDPLDPTKGSTYGPCKLMDFELEVAFFVGGSTNTDNEEEEQQQLLGRPLTLPEAQDRIFGYVLMNDWSARDIQKWEYVPLGPFTSKNFATTISTWVVTSMALEPFRCETSAGVQGGGGGGDPTPLDYLKDSNYGEKKN